MFKCRACFTEFAAEISALRHVKNPKCKGKNKKLKIKIKKCTDPGCEVEFALSKDLKKHRQDCHKKSFTCSNCHMKIAAKRNYVRHILLCRNESKSYECSLCDYFSFQKSNLDRHIKSLHKETKEKNIVEYPATFVASNDKSQICVIASKSRVVF